MRRVVIELRLPVSLGHEAVRERAKSLASAGFTWDASRPPRVSSGGRDEITPDNPTDRTIQIFGCLDSRRQDDIEAEPDVVAIFEDKPYRVN